MAKEKLKLPVIKKFKISQLNPAVYNPRTISDEALDGLGNSIKRFGCVEPIIVNIRGGGNVIVGGHQRLKALQKISDKDISIDCVTVDLSSPDEKLLNLALNNSAIQGEFIDEIQKYIDELAAQLQDDQALLDLRIDQIRGEIEDVKDKKEVEIPDEQFSVFVECKNEKEQQKCYDLLNEKGYKCRLLTI